VKGIDLEVGEGELVCLIGTNGAGKSTTLRAICGLLQAREGEVRYADADIAGTPVHELPRKGLVMVPEGRGIFAQLTVEENLVMGAFTRNDGEIARDLERRYQTFPRLKERRAQLAGTLSGGEQQMLAVSRALMLRPKLLLLDEPSFGLAPLVVQEVFGMLGTINRKERVSMLLVEQNAAMALELASRAYLIETGRVVLAGAASEIKRDDAVRRAYLGY
jgi:branched-chain amino acid transport system ATP-binding protein